MRGQTIVEYIIIVGIVVVALFAMGPMFKRGMQSVIKGTADQLAVQDNAEQDFEPGQSHMENSATDSVSRSRRAQLDTPGFTNSIVNDTSESTTKTLTDMGFSGN